MTSVPLLGLIHVLAFVCGSNPKFVVATATVEGGSMEGNSLSARYPMTEHTDISQPTILLVDDHPSIRMMLSAGLKAHGFHVLTAGTAEKALAYCENFTDRIDLLLTDIGLTPQELWPEQGSNDTVSHGVALAERAVRIRPSLPVVLFTGYSDERLKRLGARMEPFVLLRKPWWAGLVGAHLPAIAGKGPSRRQSEAWVKA